MSRPGPVIPDELASRPTEFVVGAHTVLVGLAQAGRWTVAVDGRPLEGSYRSQAEAWEAGVRDAHRLDTAG